MMNFYYTQNSNLRASGMLLEDALKRGDRGSQTNYYIKQCCDSMMMLFAMSEHRNQYSMQ